MASYSLEDFVGTGVLLEILPALVDQGWDDVPTLKMMNADDMEAHQFTQQQRDALEIRTYLHDRSLMVYADRLEASAKGLPELLHTSPSVLSSQYGMKRGHVARFIDRSSACGVAMPPTLTLPARRKTMSSVMSMDTGSEYSYYAPSVKTTPNPPPPVPNTPSYDSESFDRQSRVKTVTSENTRNEDVEWLRGPIDMGSRTPQKEKQAPPVAFKGIVAAGTPEPRLCGLVSPPPVADDVAPLSVLEKISVEKITPEYRPGIDLWGQGDLKKPPPMKATDIWSSRPTLVFCIRRPGCVMCRAEAHQLYARKPIFDALGVQLVAVLNELIDSEVRSFWPRFWGGMIVVDKNRDFFKALGGGTLPQESFITGFLFNPVAWANYKRAKATGIDSNLNGEFTVKGGLLIVRPGKAGVAYQFVERNFGDWAPLEEVLEVCGRLRQDN